MYITQFSVTKQPGDIVEANARIEYTGNVQADLRILISLASVPPITIVDGTITFDQGQIEDVRNAVQLPTNITPGSYDARCDVIRTDTNEIISTQLLPSEVTVPMPPTPTISANITEFIIT